MCSLPRIVGLAVTLLAGVVTDFAAGQPARSPREDQLVYLRGDGSLARIDSPAEWRFRRSETLAAMRSVMGPLPGPSKRCPLEVQTISVTNCGSYERRLISYASEPGSRVPAYLLIPVGASRQPGKQWPAVLALHPTDCEYGHRVLVEELRPHYRAYARDLAEMGFVVIAPAYPLLANYHPDWRALGYESGTMKAIWDNVRALDLLDSLPYVRKGRYGALGHSLGGHNAIYTALFDHRIQVIVSSCGFDSYRDYMNGDIRGWTSDRYMPGLLAYEKRLTEIPFDFHELIGALAPRRVYINAPLADSNFRHDSVDRIVAAAAGVFRLYGVPENLVVEHPKSGHDFPREQRERAYQLLRECLGTPGGAGGGT